MRKILEVFGEPIINGGQETFVNNLIENINLSDMSIDLFTPYYCENKLYKMNVEDKGGQVFEAGLKFEPGKSRFNIKNSLISIFKNNHYDVVHIHSGSVSVIAIAAQIARMNCCDRVIVHSHSPSEHETLKHMLAKLYFYRALSKYPTDYLACSMNAALWKYPKYIALKKTKIIKNGINLEKYKFDYEVRKKMRSKLSISMNEYLIGHVGRFSKEKNHLFLLNVFWGLLQKKYNVRLILLGNGKLQEDIKNKAKELGIENKVIFTGNVTNVNEYMQAFDVFVLPSLYEGLPFAGVEAQASGLPLIVSDGVSDELKITDSVEYIKLDEFEWIKAIEKKLNYHRYNNIEQLQKEGYDIIQTSEEIYDIYMN